MRSNLPCARLIGLLALASFLAAPIAVPALTYDEALRIADAETPHISAHTQAIAAAEAERKPAGALPDPKLFAALENFPVSGPMRYSLTEEFMTMQTLGVMQDVPNGDKRRAREAIAQAKVAERHNEHLVERLLVRRETSAAWIARHTSERKLELLPELEREIQILTETVRAQVAAGKAAPTDALGVKEEGAMLEDRRDELARALAQAKAALARWVGARAGEPLDGGVPQLTVEAGALRSRLAEQPALRAYALMLDSALADVRLAQSMTSVDWAVQFAYQRRAPEFGDMVSLMFTFDLPLFTGSRQEPEIEARLADTRRIQAERSAAERERLAELEQMLAERSELERRRERLRTDRMQWARERVELTLAAYRAGRAGLSEVLDARRSLIETRMNLIELDGEYHRNSASLAYLLPEVEQ